VLAVAALGIALAAYTGRSEAQNAPDGEGTKMLSKAENEVLTRIGPGTPMGNLVRQYWIPVMLSEELAEADGAPLRVRLLCEDLIMFRDTSGRVGLLDDHCSHRGASLFLGR